MYLSWARSARFGYVLAGFEFVGFLAGGLVTLFFTQGMPTCASCQTYLRRLKTATTPSLTFDEASKIVRLFESADLGQMQGLLAWRPEERKLEKDAAQARVTCNLYGCSKCKKEAITASIKDRGIPESRVA